MPEEWPQWVLVAAPILGSFIAAWWGARLAFRKTIRERALAGKVEWYQSAIRHMRAYEEVLSKLRDDRMGASVGARSFLEPYTPTSGRWKELLEAEVSLRESLQLFAVYTSYRTHSLCYDTLQSKATLGSGQWINRGKPPALSTRVTFRAEGVSAVRRRLERELRRTLQVDGWLRAVLPMWVDTQVLILSLRWQHWAEKRRAKRSLERLRARKAADASAGDADDE